MVGASNARYEDVEGFSEREIWFEKLLKDVKYCLV